MGAILQLVLGPNETFQKEAAAEKRARGELVTVKTSEQTNRWRLGDRKCTKRCTIILGQWEQVLYSNIFPVAEDMVLQVPKIATTIKIKKKKKKKKRKKEKKKKKSRSLLALPLSLSLSSLALSFVCARALALSLCPPEF